MKIADAVGMFAIIVGGIGVFVEKYSSTPNLPQMLAHIATMLTGMTVVCLFRKGKD
jgi:hypothetical protein